MGSMFSAILRKTGFVKLLSKRCRFLPDIKSDNKAKKACAERQCVNTSVQGTAADVIKMAMISLRENFERLDEQGLKSRCVDLAEHDYNYDVPVARMVSFRFAPPFF